jgi:hypothetical protein
MYIRHLLQIKYNGIMYIIIWCYNPNILKIIYDGITNV